MNKIAIVGNGQSLIGKKSGDFIDSCDRIIRMNYFEIEPYEIDVGKRIDILATGPDSLKKLPVDICKKLKEIWLPWPKNYKNGVEYRKLFEALLAQDLLDINCRFLDAKLFVSIFQSFINYEKDSLWGPTTGYRTIELAFRIFPNSEIYIAGFDFLKTGHYFNPNPFYMKLYQNPEKYKEKHAVKAEKHFIEEYIKQGKLKKIY